MDLTPVIGQFITNIWFIIPIVAVVTFFRTPWFRGTAGEFLVNILAKFSLNKDEYHLIKNVTLPTEDGTTQIDHIIVSKYGVFVIETKNMKGWIFGSPNQRMWTQKIFRHSNKFQNPLHQNYKHVETLKSALGLNDQQVHSVVVFIGDSKFKTDMPNNVTSGGGYLRFIKSKNEQVIAADEVEKIVKSINAGRLTRSFRTHREHIKHVKSMVDEKLNSNLCPKCGTPMVIREIKKGPNQGKSFWGCPNFPKCRGSAAISSLSADMSSRR